MCLLGEAASFETQGTAGNIDAGCMNLWLVCHNVLATPPDVVYVPMRKAGSSLRRTWSGWEDLEPAGDSPRQAPSPRTARTTTKTGCRSSLLSCKANGSG